MAHTFKRVMRIGFIMAVTIAAVLLSPAIEAGKDNPFGHDIPDFREVFLKLFKSQVELMSMDQLKTSSSQLTDKERAAISYYLGEEGHAQTKEGLDEEKQKFLDEKFLAHAQIEEDKDFAGLFPNILAIGNNNMNLDQMKETINRLSPEEIASMSFFMGEDGRKKLFSSMSLDRVQVILDATEDWVLIETGKRKYKQINTYTCILYKIERIDGELQGEEKILLKYREKPKAIYMKWLPHPSSPWVGREALYNERILGAGKVRVREKGILGVIPVTLPIDSEIAKRGTNHVITETGLKYLLDLIEENYRKANPNGDVEDKNYGIVDVDGHKVYKRENILSRDKSKGYYCYRLMNYIDFTRSLEIKAETWNHDNEYSESYLYTQIQINPDLTENDFDPENPDYSL